MDASFAVHNDMKSHTVMFMSMGAGSAAAASSKQKLNTTSTTESELVGVNDEMPQVLWTRYFLEAQGYIIVDDIKVSHEDATVVTTVLE